ncbi:hypothetical protein FA15DRAFT_760555 [Coprinopsis marcescibilis]|uniref:BTB domain-containing protein n=1 Tax=Coprinopsis marcescibilis TaxID=230819 RepID=A0A5C3KFE0_COPMA|nr:hypothetical protein FA15DRAFT_760555 [Coprinopsis marcescibilis]
MAELNYTPNRSDRENASQFPHLSPLMPAINESSLSDLEPLDDSDSELPELSQFLSQTLRPKNKPRVELSDGSDEPDDDEDQESSAETWEGSTDEDEYEEVEVKEESEDEAGNLQSASDIDMQDNIQPLGVAKLSEADSAEGSSVDHAEGNEVSLSPERVISEKMRPPRYQTSPKGEPQTPKRTVATPIPGRPDKGKYRAFDPYSPPPPLSEPRPRFRKRIQSTVPDAQSATAPLPKRIRRYSPAPLSDTRHHKDERYWHLDGSLLVQIGNTRYNVHRSVLLSHSAWFADLFRDAKDARRSTTGIVKGDRLRFFLEEDGSTIVVLDPLNIKQEDFVAFLHFLYDPFYLVETTPPIERVTSVLVASHFLQVPRLHLWASNIFAKAWSSDLSAFTPEPLPNALATLSLARRCKLPISVTKRAMYEILRLKDFGTVEGNDLDIEFLEARPIPQDDLMKLVRARVKLQEQWMHEMRTSSDLFECAGAQRNSEPSSSSVPPPSATGGQSTSRSTMAASESLPTPTSESPPPNIQHPLASGSTSANHESTASCPGGNKAAVSQAHYRLIIEPAVLDAYTNDVVNGYKALIDLEWKKEGFCDACVERRRVMWTGRRERLWRDCDILFGFKK